MAVSVRVSGGKAWKKALKPYADAEGEGVKVGILEGATYAEGPNAGELVAPIAAIHEFGAANVPARSFMRSTLEKKKEEWVQNAVTVLKARPGDFRAAFTAAGHQAVANITEAIEAGIAPPLSTETVAAKIRRKGTKGKPELPLVDTGTMEMALGYEVNEVNQQIFPNRQGGA